MNSIEFETGDLVQWKTKDISVVGLIIKTIVIFHDVDTDEFVREYQVKWLNNDIRTRFSEQRIKSLCKKL